VSSQPLRVPGPDGRTIDVPALDDAASAGSRPESGELAARYAEDGYVVFPGLLPEEACEAVRRTFEAEVRPHRGPLYRQTTGRPERHAFTPQGHVANPIQNVQDLRASRFPSFQRAALDLLTHERVQAAVETLLTEPGRIVQTMLFEANPATPPHQDTYYLDSTDLGRMVAGWFALEDIAPGAGRFFVYPGSHRIDVARNAGDFDAAFHHDRYHSLVVETVRDRGLECRAPALRRGDVLFWNSRTIHGSLATTDPSASRFSLTAHYVPVSGGFLQLQSRRVPLNVRRVNGMAVHRHRDQDRLRSRVAFFLASRLPRGYAFAKRCAVKLLVR